MPSTNKMINFTGLAFSVRSLGITRNTNGLVTPVAIFSDTSVQKHS